MFRSQIIQIESQNVHRIFWTPPSGMWWMSYVRRERRRSSAVAGPPSVCGGGNCFAGRVPVVLR